MSVSASITSSTQSQISRICRSWYAICWALTCAGVSLGMRRTISFAASVLTSSALAAAGLAASDLPASGLLAEAEGAAVSLAFSIAALVPDDRCLLFVEEEVEFAGEEELHFSSGRDLGESGVRR